jgi:hypothetical protein
MSIKSRKHNWKREEKERDNVIDGLNDGYSLEPVVCESLSNWISTNEHIRFAIIIVILI